MRELTKEKALENAIIERDASIERIDTMVSGVSLLQEETVKILEDINIPINTSTPDTSMLQAELDKANSELEELRKAVHPWYGECDGNAEGGKCAECEKCIESIGEWFKGPAHTLSKAQMEALYRTLEAKDKEISRLMQDAELLNPDHVSCNEQSTWYHSKVCMLSISNNNMRSLITKLTEQLKFYSEGQRPDDDTPVFPSSVVELLKQVDETLK